MLAALLHHLVNTGHSVSLYGNDNANGTGEAARVMAHEVGTFYSRENQLYGGFGCSGWLDFPCFTMGIYKRFWYAYFMTVENRLTRPTKATISGNVC
jgi:hypothetical protein